MEPGERKFPLYALRAPLALNVHERALRVELLETTRAGRRRNFVTPTTGIPAKMYKRNRTPRLRSRPRNGATLWGCCLPRPERRVSQERTKTHHRPEVQGLKSMKHKAKLREPVLMILVGLYVLLAAFGIWLLRVGTSQSQEVMLLGLMVPIRVAKGMGIIAVIFSATAVLIAYGSALPCRPAERRK
jgi:hypothetical protein